MARDLLLRMILSLFDYAWTTTLWLPLVKAFEPTAFVQGLIVPSLRLSSMSRSRHCAHVRTIGHGRPKLISGGIAGSITGRLDRSLHQSGKGQANRRGPFAVTGSV